MPPRWWHRWRRYGAGHRNSPGDDHLIGDVFDHYVGDGFGRLGPGVLGSRLIDQIVGLEECRHDLTGGVTGRGVGTGGLVSRKTT